MVQEAQSIFPTFRFRDAAAMIDWLTDVVGFTVHARYDNEDGSVGHAELALGASIIMLGDDRDDAYGAMVGRPGEQGGKSLYVAIDDVDALFGRIERSGARIEQGLTKRDYGSYEFICRDPEGSVWCFGTYRPGAADKG